MSIVTQQLEPKVSMIPFRKRDSLPEVSHKDLPTMYDLPSENKTEEPALDEFHDLQADLLTESCFLPDYPKDQVFTAADMYLYYDPKHPTWYKRADWFAVVGVSRRYTGRGRGKGRDDGMRSSYVIWEERVSPYIVAEFLSPSTKNEDLGRISEVTGNPPPKWKVYEQILKIPYYLLFDKRTEQLQAFRLVNNRYSKLDVANNRLWIPEQKVGLGLWDGVYQGITRNWLRWYDTNGEWIPTLLERAELRAEQAQQQLERERQAKEQQMINVARNLLSTMDNETIRQITGLELAFIQELR
ncbi:Uma2 family endonuclease [Anaerolineales bacterium HSG24]|nr:Uma2 family endonuclease [Anaerolineales bacterium HSG24]